MNKTLMAAGLAVILGACSSSKKSDVAEGATPNPFFAEYTTPFGVPPFDQIEVAHYKPALLKGMEEQSKEIEAIVNNPEEPTFENTILAYDNAGQMLAQTELIFGMLCAAETNERMQALQEQGMARPQALAEEMLARGWRRYVGTPRRYRGGSRARAR
mgnify:CR=1 FL=1